MKYTLFLWVVCFFAFGCTKDYDYPEEVVPEITAEPCVFLNWDFFTQLDFGLWEIDSIHQREWLNYWSSSNWAPSWEIPSTFSPLNQVSIFNPDDYEVIYTGIIANPVSVNRVNPTNSSFFSSHYANPGVHPHVEYIYGQVGSLEIKTYTDIQPGSGCQTPDKIYGFHIFLSRGVVVCDGSTDNNPTNP